MRTHAGLDRWKQNREEYDIPKMDVKHFTSQPLNEEIRISQEAITSLEMHGNSSKGASRRILFRTG